MFKKIFSMMLAMLLCLGMTVCAETLSDYEDGVYQITVKDGEIVDASLIASEDEMESVSEAAEALSVDLADGEYAIEAELAGGSGKASIETPMLLIVEDGKAYALVRWSSSNYDYMIVGGEKYLNEAAEGANSQFHIPITLMDEPMQIKADTLAMGTPHEIAYTLTFFSDSIGSKDTLPQEAAKRVIMTALAIIIGGGILNHYVNKKNRV